MKEEFYFAVITHNFPNTQLPINLDYSFYDKDSQKSQILNVTVRACINYRYKLHTELWQGYNHCAIIQIHDLNMEKIQPLPNIKSTTKWDSNLILCKSKEFIQCREFIKSSVANCHTFMRTRNPKIWEENRRKEQEYRDLNR
ncbi:MAG: hypothetical protein GY827_10960 [Cytophagales bacterium]|nr:hypothetical protein [Cytophagales bacterium]